MQIDKQEQLQQKLERLQRTFGDIGRDIGQLVERKNAAYGNSFIESGKIMRLLYPNGISAAQMEEALLVVRIIDKLFRIATDKDAFGETPFSDISGYGICGTFLSELRKNDLESKT